MPWCFFYDRPPTVYEHLMKDWRKLAALQLSEFAAIANDRTFSTHGQSIMTSPHRLLYIGNGN